MVVTTPMVGAPDLSVLDDRKMTEAAIIQRPQRVDGAALGRDGGGIRRHRLRQRRHRSNLTFRKCTHCVAAGEDAAQPPLVVDHEHRTGATLAHACRAAATR